MSNRKPVPMKPMTGDTMEILDPYIKSEGGARLLTNQDRCLPKTFKIEGPMVEKTVETTTCGCGGMFRAVISLMPPIQGAPDPPEREDGFATFCAHCDGAHYWPRFDEICVEIED